MTPGDGPDRLAQVIADLGAEDGRFHMEGGSWTNNISWVRGYDDVLIPMERASAQFHERVLARDVPSSDPGYRNALSTFSPARPAAIATGARACGQTTAPRSPAARRRPLRTICEP